MAGEQGRGATGAEQSACLDSDHGSSIAQDVTITRHHTMASNKEVCHGDTCTPRTCCTRAQANRARSCPPVAV